MDSRSSSGSVTASSGPEVAKRRKIRKGTFSCWECKRRKMKCVFGLSSNPTCNACWRRGSPCIGQQFSDLSPSIGKIRKPCHSFDEVDTSQCDYSSFIGEPSAEDGSSNASARLNKSPSASLQRELAFCRYSPHHRVKTANSSSGPATLAINARYDSLSHFLHESLPKREDLVRFAGHGPSILAHEVLFVPNVITHQNGLKSPESLLEIPGPNVHPVLISRYMLKVALFLQHLPPDLQKDIKELSESPRAIMERLADLAIRLVTTNDEFLGSIEGLECVVMETMYQVNIGNLRQSWLTNRKAMGIAQLMSLHQSGKRAHYKVLEPTGIVYPQNMWFRIVELDRYLSLMLGLPQGCLDQSMASDLELANDMPIGRLERIHCVIASRILERGENKLSNHNLSLTRDLDMDLQKAARRLPSKWWLAPDLTGDSKNSKDVFWNMRRLYTQVLHYNLLNLLHLPYMLHSSSAERSYEYARITCVNSSREILSRFIGLRSFNRIAYSCRILDFLALMAALTLLLAHLDSHHSGPENLLAHQFLSDRAMVEQALDSMKELNRLNSDALSAQSAELLRQMLDLEVETLEICTDSGNRVTIHDAGSEMALPDKGNEASIVQMQIPYFGVIHIARETMKKEVLRPQATANIDGQQVQSRTEDRPITKSVEDTNEDSISYHSRLAASTGLFNAEGAIHREADKDCVPSSSISPQQMPHANDKTQTQRGHFAISATRATELATYPAPQIQTGLCDPPSQQGEWPGLLASGEDWAFQGVDMTFFESLMSGTENFDGTWAALSYPCMTSGT